MRPVRLDLPQVARALIEGAPPNAGSRCALQRESPLMLHRATAGRQSVRAVISGRRVAALPIEDPVPVDPAKGSTISNTGGDRRYEQSEDVVWRAGCHRFDAGCSGGPGDRVAG